MLVRAVLTCVLLIAPSLLRGQTQARKASATSVGTDQRIVTVISSSHGGSGGGGLAGGISEWVFFWVADEHNAYLLSCSRYWRWESCPTLIPGEKYFFQKNPKNNEVTLRAEKNAKPLKLRLEEAQPRTAEALATVPAPEKEGQAEGDLDEIVSRFESDEDTWKSACTSEHIAFKECRAQVLAAKPALDGMHLEWQQFKAALVRERSASITPEDCRVAADQAIPIFDRYLSIQDELLAMYESVDPDSANAQSTWTAANARYLELQKQEQTSLADMNKVLPRVTGSCPAN